jgi:hypothetical protein
MYKNKVSKYQNKLNQVGGACPFKNGDIVIKKDYSNYGTVIENYDPGRIAAADSI